MQTISQYHSYVNDFIEGQWISLPYFSRNLSAFSRNDGPPSISSKASKIGLPTTKDLTGCLSLPELKETWSDTTIREKLQFHLDITDKSHRSIEDMNIKVWQRTVKATNTDGKTLQQNHQCHSGKCHCVP